MSTKPNQTPHDGQGVPIYEGDMVRTFHYRHYRNRRKTYLYHVVKKVKGELWAMHYTVAAYPRKEDGSCPLHVLLRNHNDAEVVAGNHILPFFERKRTTHTNNRTAARGIE